MEKVGGDIYDCDSAQKNDPELDFSNNKADGDDIIGDAYEYLMRNFATESGKSIAETLKTSLAISVRDRAYTAALKMVARFKNAKENDIKISKEDGRTFITCSAIDNGQPFMTVKLLVGDEEQALFIKNRFLNDSSIYSKIIELLTKE